MLNRLVALFLVGFAAQLPAQVEIPAHILALSRIEARMQSSLQQVPNYTCTQTIERTRLAQAAIRRLEKKLERRGETRAAVDFPVESSDSIEVELAYVDGREMYSWPGAESFEEKPLAAMVGFGNLTTGVFAATAHNLFVAKAARLEPVGHDVIDGRSLLRFDFQVGLFRSGFFVRDSTGREAQVSYSGSIWADPETNDLVRIETHAEDIPPYLEIASTMSRIDYQRVELSGSSFLLPKRAHEVTRLRSGAENHNRTEFTNCRRFGASSEISYGGDDSVDEAKGAAEWNEIELPEGVRLAIRLTSEIDLDQAKIGDQVEGALEADARRQGDVLAPEGARVLGRIRRLERYSEPAPYYTLGVDFSELRFGETRAAFVAEMTQASPMPGLTFGRPGDSREGGKAIPFGQSSGPIRRYVVESYTDINLEGVGVVSIQGRKIQLPAGLRMVWETVAPGP